MRHPSHCHITITVLMMVHGQSIATKVHVETVCTQSFLRYLLSFYYVPSTEDKTWWAKKRHGPCPHGIYNQWRWQNESKRNFFYKWITAGTLQIPWEHIQSKYNIQFIHTTQVLPDTRDYLPSGRFIRQTQDWGISLARRKSECSWILKQSICHPTGLRNWLVCKTAAPCRTSS